ncbi:MAG: AraC family transcriptional regulator [Oscillospiraceae bacterium]
MKVSEVKVFAEKCPELPGMVNAQQLLSVLIAYGVNIKNIYQELEMESAFVDVHNDISFSQDTIQLHSHIFYEIMLCQGGNVQYILNDKRYRLKRGDVVIIPPCVSHRPLFMEELTEPYKRIVLWINASFLDRVTTAWPMEDFSFAQGGFILRTEEYGADGFSPLFEALLTESENMHSGWQAAISGGVMQLLVHLIRAHSNEAVSPSAESGSLLDDVMYYIDHNLTQKITLENVARHFFVSRSSISHLFSQKLGISFYHYIIQHRLIAAKSKILDGVPMGDICTECGFADYSSFYRLFKKEYGISPLEYKRVFGI